VSAGFVAGRPLPQGAGDRVRNFPVAAAQISRPGQV